MDSNKGLRRNVMMAFKLNGLAIKGDAFDYLCKQLSPISENLRDTWLVKITEFLQRKQSLIEPVIEKNHIELAIQECCKSEGYLADDVLQVISAFEIPKFYYSADSKKFLKFISNDHDGAATKLLSSASKKVDMYQTRYVMLKQRLDRHDLLNSCSSQLLDAANGKTSSTVKLNSIDHLLSLTNEEQVQTIVLGLLSQLTEGRYFLEDPSGILPIDLSNATYHPGFFTENCFVLAEGVYDGGGGSLKVHGLAHPPPEHSKVSRTYFGNSNTFGGRSDTCQKSSARMMTYEQENDEAMIVFVSDIYLDRVKVLEKLKSLFSGFDDDTPAIIVLMGNFLSATKNSQYFQLLRSKFAELANIISEYTSLVQDTLFVIVPGPTDSPAANILPRPALSDFITAEFKKKIPKCIFATNPCRIQYCTQEIVIFREDVLTKMYRNSIHFPDLENIPGQFARTIISQSHLAPLPLSVCPVYWSYDHCLSLYPLPDVVVIADQMNSFVETYKDVIMINPSSFSMRQFIFKVYIPSKKQIEDSQIPDVV